MSINVTILLLSGLVAATYALFPGFSGFPGISASGAGRTGAMMQPNMFIKPPQCIYPPTPWVDTNQKAQDKAQSPFVVTFDPVPGNMYKPNNPITVKLKSTNTNKFQGFFLTVKSNLNMPMIGTFAGQWNCPSQAKQHRLCMNPGVTNIDTFDKSMVSCTWTPPHNVSIGIISFSASVVQSPTVFYDEITSTGSLNPDPSVPTFKQIMEAQVKAFMAKIGGMGSVQNVMAQMRNGNKPRF